MLLTFPLSRFRVGGITRLMRASLPKVGRTKRHMELNAIRNKRPHKTQGESPLKFVGAASRIYESHL